MVAIVRLKMILRDSWKIYAAQRRFHKIRNKAMWTCLRFRSIMNQAIKNRGKKYDLRTKIFIRNNISFKAVILYFW